METAEVEFILRDLIADSDLSVIFYTGKRESYIVCYNNSKKEFWDMGKAYGYVRVSTKEQNAARQVAAMKAYGVKPACMVIEKQSGKDFERPQYQRMIQQLQEGDTIVIKSIDRLGRNYEEILEQWRMITKEKKAAIVVLDMPLLNTERDRDLTGILISDIVLQLLSYVAQTEREFIRQRQKEGIAAAKARGVRFGRPRKPVPKEFYHLRKAWEQQAISSREAARRMGIAQNTFLRWCREK